MIKYKILCDECGSDNILHEMKRFPEPEPIKVSMSQYIEKRKFPPITPAVHHYTHYILLCKDCGHKKEYQI